MFLTGTVQKRKEKKKKDSYGLVFILWRFLSRVSAQTLHEKTEGTRFLLYPCQERSVSQAPVPRPAGPNEAKKATWQPVLFYSPFASSPLMWLRGHPGTEKGERVQLAYQAPPDGVLWHKQRDRLWTSASPSLVPHPDTWPGSSLPCPRPAWPQPSPEVEMSPLLTLSMNGSKSWTGGSTGQR